MAAKSGREALRGAEVNMLDFIFEVLTSQQWAELLKAPLECAAAKGNRDLVQRLVRAGAQIGTALHGGSVCGHGEIVSDLLESGASLASKDMHGRTPLHVAARRGKTEMVKMLLLKGADKDALDNEECTPLFLAARKGHLAATLALLAAGADASLRCYQIKAPVMIVAAQEGYVELLRAMIEHGADVDAVDTHQRTALHAAAWYNRAGAIDVLVEAGANIESRDARGRTHVHTASYNLSHKALQSLLIHGATVNAQSDSLTTPLMYAAMKAGTQGAAEVVDALLRAGADETIVDNIGRKASDVIGTRTAEGVRLVEDVKRVRKLLANAPADRAWRRRGYLVLCRAHADRVQQQPVMRGIHHSNVARKTHSGAELAKAGVVEWDSTVDESNGADWTVGVAKMLQFQEEGIFRAIMGYL